MSGKPLSSEYIDRFREQRDKDGRRQVIRNGKAKERKITTGAGTIGIEAPRVNDKRPGQKLSSVILLPYLRKSKNVM